MKSMAIVVIAKPEMTCILTGRLGALSINTMHIKSNATITHLIFLKDLLSRSNSKIPAPIKGTISIVMKNCGSPWPKATTDAPR